MFYMYFLVLIIVEAIFKITFKLQYTNFILMNGSGLDTEGKNKKKSILF